MSSDELPPPLPAPQDQNGYRSAKPGSGLVRTIGVLNVVLGLGAASVLAIAGAIAMIFIVSRSQALQENADDSVERLEQLSVDYEAELATREAVASAADDLQELQSIEEERASLESVQEDFDNRSREAATDGRWLAWGTAADFGSSVIFNLLLALAGVGLLMKARWGRKLTQTQAVLKLLRLPFVGWFYFVVGTPFAQGFLQESALVGAVYSVILLLAMQLRDIKHFFGSVVEDEAIA